MARNGVRADNGLPVWRCGVAHRERNRRFRDRQRETVTPPAPLTADELALAERSRLEQRRFDRAARRQLDELAARAAAEGTGPESLLPMRYLWHATRDVLELLEAAFGDELDEALRFANVERSYRTTRERDYVNLAQADRLLAPLGLHIDRLGPPMFSAEVPAAMVAA